MRRLSLLITVLVVALLAPAASALASTGQTTSFEAPRDLLDPAARDGAFNDIASFGVHSIRLVMYWRDGAPSARARVKPKFDATDPSAYNWSRYEPVVDAADAPPAAGSGVTHNSGAPVPPALSGSRYGPVVDAPDRRGGSVLLALGGPAPRGPPNAARRAVARPRPNERRMFVTAAAKHFGD